ncbi:MAG: SLC13 family permease [Methanomicrobiales archaeon]|nr:SLC13 family permease [Methanomicrobiales archaeon]
MLGGALTALITGQIAPLDAVRAIDPGVMVFLFGMFVIGEAISASGYLSCLAESAFRRVVTPRALVLALIVTMGAASALLMNDTLAIIGTPLSLHLARVTGISPLPLLLTLCFAITTGSMASPIGNPQNLLIATSPGIQDPFPLFLFTLGPIAVVNLIIAYAFLLYFYRRDLAPRIITVPTGCITDPVLARIAKLSLLIVIAMIALQFVPGVGTTLHGAGIAAIAIAGAAPVLLFAPSRWHILRNIDWPTLIFFAALFVLMAAVFNSGVFQEITEAPLLTTVPGVLFVSVVTSQVISNVPFVALFLPAIAQGSIQPGVALALAAGSTLAGNLTILGAASNVIVVQNAEKEGVTITFWEFLRIGAPLTLVQCVVTALLLTFLV